jgi:anhydro-N-acetylmuramic acid kinase
MNPTLVSLMNLASSPKRRILGLMSGTSLDGLDMALCIFTNHGIETRVEIEKFTTYPYNENFKDKIKQVFPQKSVDLAYLCLLNEWVGIEHAKIINEQLRDWGIQSTEVDLIASHGQTIFHAPSIFHQNSEFPNGTLQIGDGDHIAQHTQIITLSDFRQKHLAAGGEGAPLAPYGESLLFTHPTINRILINIGGIANFTFLPAYSNSERVISSDVGPGNTLMDAYVRKHFQGYSYDPDGTLSRKGVVIEDLLETLLKDPFFKKPFPKSTGPETFNIVELEEKIKHLKTRSNRFDLEKEYSKENILATLNEFTARIIYEGILPCLDKNSEVYISGGGVHNLALRERIQKKIKTTELQTTEALGINPDAKEAVLWALLANECVAGNSEDFRMIGSHYPMVSMGKISLPN